MGVIKSIIRVRDMGTYKLTDALMEDGLEATAYTPSGDEFKVGEHVETFYHEQYNKVKFRRTPRTPER
jgi:hypothetical protein